MLRVGQTSEDDAIVHVSADVQVTFAYALLDQPCSSEQRSLWVLGPPCSHMQQCSWAPHAAMQGAPGRLLSSEPS